jgi:ABC-type sugar transport system substrate-binding protein
MRSKNTKLALLILLLGIVAAAAWGAFRLRKSNGPVNTTIALIPRSSEALLWDLAHSGAAAEAQRHDAHLYWNAPTSETDIAGQASLLDRIARGDHRGLILAPNHAYFPLSALKRVLAARIPVVVIADQLDLSPSPLLTQVLNDNARMGELAAIALARQVKSGPVVFIGLNRTAPGVLERLHAAESYLQEHHPNIQVLTRISSAYVPARAEEFLRAELATHPNIAGVIGLTAAASRGALAAIRSVNASIPLIACEQDTDLVAALKQGELAGIVAVDTYRMGQIAVQHIAGNLKGNAMPAATRIAPVLLSRENCNSPAHKFLLSSDTSAAP